MILSRRTLKRMKNLEEVCSFDTVNKVATLDLHFATVSEILDEKVSDRETLIVNSETIELLENSLLMVPGEFVVNYRITIDDYHGYDVQAVQSALYDTMQLREYRQHNLKNQTKQRMSVFLVIGLLVLALVVYTSGNGVFAAAGLPISATIAFILELLFEVYFEKGVSHFFVSRIYEKMGGINRLGTIDFGRLVE